MADPNCRADAQLPRTDEDSLPDATPDTQGEPRAKAGGAYAQDDFSPSAQRSRDRETADDARLVGSRQQPGPAEEA